MGGELQLHGRPIERVLRLAVDLRAGQRSYEGRKSEEIHRAMRAQGFPHGCEPLAGQAANPWA